MVPVVSVTERFHCIPETFNCNHCKWLLHIDRNKALNNSSSPQKVQLAVSVTLVTTKEKITIAGIAKS